MSLSYLTHLKEASEYTRYTQKIHFKFKQKLKSNNSLLLVCTSSFYY